LIRIKSFISKHQGSNTWLICNETNQGLIIDPGDPDPATIIQYIRQKELNIEGIYLTHEHSDHCSGANNLNKLYKIPIYGIKECIDGIKNPKQNFSAYLNDIDIFSVENNTHFIEDKDIITVLVNHKLEVMSTPGHSPGSTCFFIENMCFTGDTLLNKAKTPLTFPHSDRNAFYRSLAKLKQRLKHGMMVLPGHGDKFVVQ